MDGLRGSSDRRCRGFNGVIVSSYKIPHLTREREGSHILVPRSNRTDLHVRSIPEICSRHHRHALHSSQSNVQIAINSYHNLAPNTPKNNAIVTISQHPQSHPASNLLLSHGPLSRTTLNQPSEHPKMVQLTSSPPPQPTTSS